MRVRPLPAILLLALAGCDGQQDEGLPGDPEAGRRAIARLDCGVCHVIPGIAGARGSVGPSLEGFALRAYIAGVHPNRAAVLTAWVRDAPSLVPDTAMPPMPLDENEARDVASYLYTLR